jgi:hypothetical protein
VQIFSLDAVHPEILCDYSENPVAARYKAWVFGRTVVGIKGSNPAGGIDVLSLVSDMCCQVVMCLRWVDHSSGGVLPTVVFLCVI